MLAEAARPTEARPSSAAFSGGVLRSAGAVAALAAVVFVGFGAEQLWHLHADDAAGRSALETTITLSALVATILLAAHFRRTRRLRDLFLVAALGVAALTDFIFNALPAYHYQTGLYGAGARMALAILIAVTFAAAAFVSARRVVLPGRHLGRLVFPAALCWLAFGEAIDMVAGPVRTVGAPGDFRPLSIAAGLTEFVLLTAATAGFLARRKQGDAGAGLLGVTALLIGGADLSKLALPVVQPTWVIPADALRLGAFALMLVLGIDLYRRSREQQAMDAVAAERQRIARDLHDGLAQDLAFIAAHSERLASTYGSDHPLAIAAARALDASRGKIADLEASAAPTAEAALREVAAELAARFDIRVTVAVAGPGPTASDEDRRELVRIAREAIVNAAVHGRARRVAVTLGGPERGLLLRVVDDGCGLSAAVSETRGTGLGLRTMRARAQGLGAAIEVTEGDLGGTRVDVVTPG